METQRPPTVPSAGLQIVGLLGWLLLCFGASALGAWATYPQIPGWYASLERPSFAPPNWVFGPVWTTLYAMMAVAAWLVWRQGGWGPAWPALTLFLVQLALNTLWSFLFFGLQSPGAAFVEIVVLWLAIAATLAAFWPRSVAAGLLLAPYLAWVSFAAVLNYWFWQLNA